MSRGAIHRPADVMVFVVCLCAAAFVLGMDAGRPAPQAQCGPGYVTSVRWPDGKLDCYHERADWRRPLERKASR